MAKLEKWLEKAARELEIDVRIRHVIEVSHGRQIVAVALLPDLGAKKGMLVFNSYDQIRELKDELVELGYGYSVLDDPRCGEVFGLDSFREMFVDWGWSGARSRAPQWWQVQDSE